MDPRILLLIIGTLLFIFFFIIASVEKHIDKEWYLTLELAFFVTVYSMYLVSLPQLNWHALIILSLGLLLMRTSKDTKASMVLLMISGAFGFLLAYVGRSIFLQIEQGGESFLRLIFFPSVNVPFFYFFIPLAGISSSLFAWSFTVYIGTTVNLIRGKESVRAPITRKKDLKLNLKSTLAYLQLIPVGLIPLVIPHIFRNYVWLYDVSNILGSLCLSQLYFIPFSLLIAFARKRIFESPFFRVTSVFTLLSLFSVFYSLFEYIALNVHLGVLIISLMLSSLLGASLGFSMSDSSRE